jgi:uncharacterized membrane protein YhaH (DUF805 family)
MSLGQILFSFGGRINRGKYWLAAVIYFVVWILASILFTLFIARDVAGVPDVGNMSTEQTTRMILNMGIGVVLFFAVVLIPTFLSTLAVSLKRLHDRNKSGWWLLLFWIGPGVIMGVQQSYQHIEGSWILGLIAVAIMIWAIVELGFLRGTAGPNQYGPDPLAPAAPAPAPTLAA